MSFVLDIYMLQQEANSQNVNLIKSYFHFLISKFGIQKSDN